MVIVTDKRCLHAPRRSAFTLLEILVVVAIVVTMASVSGVFVFRYLEDSKKSKAQLDIKAFETAVKAYQTKNDNNPPDSLRDALRFIDNADESKLMDPWNHPYQYNKTQGPDGSEIIIISTKAPDGTEITNLKVKNH